MPAPSRRAAVEAEDVADDSVDPGPPRLDFAAEEEAEDATELATPFDSCGEEPNDGGVLDPVAEMVKLGRRIWSPRSGNYGRER